jgi:CubicO group peptidase (beta-lactamase class C family)
MVSSEHLNAVIDAALGDERIVGTQVRVMHRGELAYQRDAGYADRERAVPVRDDTIFRYDSLTKTYTSVAAVILMERGVISADDPVSRCLPEFTPRLPNGEPAGVQIRHLLTHTAGLSIGAGETGPFPYRDAGVSDCLDLPGISMSENLGRLSTVPLLIKPGERFEYSIGIDVLGELVGRVHGGTLGEAVRDLITNPLATEGPRFTLPDDERGRVAVPYIDGSPRPVRMPTDYVPDVPETGPHRNLERLFDPEVNDAGGSGLAGTADDFVMLMEALRTGTPRLVDDLSLLANNQIAPLEIEPGVGHSFGWSIVVDPVRAGTPQAAGTWGWAGGLGNRWFVDPARELTVVSLTNTSYAGCFGPYPDAIRDAVYDVQA